ncbi:MAG: hypothetical protein JWO50_292 [Candidatus Kaiserbacteria bacterium]|nr:hypothetical protein [Candidatus Kaiserbacteria bacterium]
MNMNQTNKIIIGVIVLLVVLVGGYFIYKHFSQTPEQKLEEQSRMLIASVSKHMLLPSNETPEVYEIKDPATLAKQQVFFADAQVGDELLVFSQAGKAIIYSPGRDVIVNVGPITGQASTTPPAKK